MMSPARRLTEDALAAAMAGRWDAVRACYEQRSGSLTEPMTPADAEALLAMDHEVRARALAAQRVVGALLTEASAVRRRLNSLRPDPQTMARESHMAPLKA